MRSLDRLFSLARGFLFLTPEEQALVADSCSHPLAPSRIVGSGLEPVIEDEGSDVSLESLGVVKPFVLYLGRIDPNKGCETLVRHFLRRAPGDRSIQLVMAGPENMPMPNHPRIRRLGFVGEAAREALLSNAAVLAVPSPFESLSLVLLEAWNHRVPALVNGRCGVLKGQAIRANGALYYRNVDEFACGLSHLLNNPDVARQLGEQGLAYVNREYRWPHVISKIDGFLSAL
jgi:glycosyltransferase involved in cell wall biosynthesis